MSQPIDVVVDDEPDSEDFGKIVVEMPTPYHAMSVRDAERLIDRLRLCIDTAKTLPAPTHHH